MNKNIRMIEKVLTAYGYSFIVGQRKSNHERLYLFWNTEGKITFGCSFNESAEYDNTVDFGVLEYNKVNEELCLSYYAGCILENLTEQMILGCISQVKESVNHDMEDDVLDEWMRSILRLGNHTTDIEEYLQKFGYTIPY